MTRDVALRRDYYLRHVDIVVVLNTLDVFSYNNTDPLGGRLRRYVKLKNRRNNFLCLSCLTMLNERTNKRLDDIPADRVCVCHKNIILNILLPYSAHMREHALKESCDNARTDFFRSLGSLTCCLKYSKL